MKFIRNFIYNKIVNPIKSLWDKFTNWFKNWREERAKVKEAEDFFKYIKTDPEKAAKIFNKKFEEYQERLNKHSEEVENLLHTVEDILRSPAP